MLLRHSEPLVKNGLILCFQVKSVRSGSETQRTADLAIAVCFSAFDKTQRNGHFFDFASRNDALSAISVLVRIFSFLVTKKLLFATSA